MPKMPDRNDVTMIPAARVANIGSVNMTRAYDARRRVANGIRWPYPKKD